MAKAKAPAGKAMSKSALFAALAADSMLTKKQVACCFDALAGQIKKNLGKKGPGLFTVPGLLKLKVVRKPATKARPGVNPFTGEQIMIKAKPARNVVKATALKALKDMV